MKIRKQKQLQLKRVLRSASPLANLRRLHEDHSFQKKGFSKTRPINNVEEDVDSLLERLENATSLEELMYSLKRLRVRSENCFLPE